MKKGEVKGSPSRYEIKNKTSRKRSLEKFGSNQKVSDRVSFNQLNSGQHQSTLGIKSKMMKINGILNGKVNGSEKEMMR